MVQILREYALCSLALQHKGNYDAAHQLADIEDAVKTLEKHNFTQTFRSDSGIFKAVLDLKTLNVRG